MENLQKLIASELEKLSRGFIATPNTVEDLEAFARSNNGSSDILLMQMAMNFGYKIALENVKEELEKEDQKQESVVEGLVVGKDYYFDNSKSSYGTYMGVYDGSLEFTPKKLGSYATNGKGYVDFSVHFVEGLGTGFPLKED